jgi:hypothetical protein
MDQDVEALYGIAMPDDGDITMGGGAPSVADAASVHEADEEEDDEYDGLGALENAAAKEFFVDQPPSSKRQKTRASAAAAEAAAAAAAEGEGEGEEDDEDAIEKPRSADAPMADGPGLPGGDDFGFGLDDPMLPAGADEPPPPADEPPPPPSSSRAGRRSSAAAEQDIDAEFELQGSAAPAARQQRARKPKRKVAMVLDREIQLSAETIRAELSDTSALVRDLAKEAAEDAAAAAAGGAAYDDDDELDLFDGPPDPSIVPQAALGLFRLTGPVLKRARVGENWELAGANPVGEAARAPAARGAAADGDGDEEEEGEGTQDELPRRRSSRFAEPEAPADGAFEFDGPMAFDEPPPPADDEPPPPFEADPAGPEVVGFAASIALPNVGEGDDVAVLSKQDSKSSQDSASQRELGSQPDPSKWAPRTGKVYEMLRGTFDQSADEALSFNAMIDATKNNVEKRRVVAGAFQELLFLSTHGLLYLEQARPYADIIIDKTEAFDTVGEMIDAA